jgi:hypothetical protein
MEDEDDAGEQTNAIYYAAIWTKGHKVRIEVKRAKVKVKKMTEENKWRPNTSTGSSRKNTTTRR